MPWTTCSFTEMHTFLGNPYSPLKAQMPPRLSVSRSAMASSSSSEMPGTTAFSSSSSTSQTIRDASRIHATSSCVLISMPPAILLRLPQSLEDSLADLVQRTDPIDPAHEPPLPVVV